MDRKGVNGDEVVVSSLRDVQIPTLTSGGRRPDKPGQPNDDGFSGKNNHDKQNQMHALCMVLIKTEIAREEHEAKMTLKFRQ